MSRRRLMNRLSYFTIEDESMLAEAFAEFDEDIFAVTYKVEGTEGVFVTTAETREAMDRNDVAYNLLAEEDSNNIAVYHTILSKEELADYEDAIKALALAYKSVAIACIGVNGETDLGFDLSDGAEGYTYFTAPAGHTFIWRVFATRDDALDFLGKLSLNDKHVVDWVKSIPLASSDELISYH